MRRIYLLGILAVFLTGCTNDSPTVQGKEKHAALRETELIFQIRSAQAEYEAYLKDRLASCQLRSEVLTRDQDGVLVCVVPQKKSEENK